MKVDDLVKIKQKQDQDKAMVCLHSFKYVFGYVFAFQIDAFFFSNYYHAFF